MTTKKSNKKKSTNQPKGIAAIVKLEKEKTKPGKNTILTVEEFVDKLNSAIKKEKITAEATLGGSVAKGTFIKDNFDADIFIKFDSSYRGKNISDILEKILVKLKLSALRVHGSRDYFQIKKDFTYELVPVLNVKDYREAENVADMSPLHVKYFKKQAAKNKELRDEIRVTKVFMKSARVYGAESYIKGFSGHVVDLLVIKYKTFQGLVKAAAKWKDEVVIDIERYHIDPKMSLNTSKIAGPLIIVDPIQKNRNAAAALSKECFERFKKRCAEFLECPTEDYFAMPNFSNEIDDKISQTKNAITFIFNIAPLDGKRDVIGSKVLKIKEHIEAEARKNDFRILWSDWEFNEQNSRIAIAVDSKNLSPTKMLQGPPLSMTESAAEFRKAHKKVFGKNGTLFAEEKRIHVSASTLLEEATKSVYVKEKCKSISLIKAQ